MSSETEKKRKRYGQDGQDGGSPAAEQGAGGGDTAAPDTMMAEMRAMLGQTRLNMTQMQNEMDSMKSLISCTDENCRFLEARCGSLERTVQVLTKHQKWEYSAPSIPSSYWTELFYFNSGCLEMRGTARKFGRPLT